MKAQNFFSGIADSWRAVFRDKSDPWCPGRRGIFMGNAYINVFNQLSAGIFFTTILLLLLDGVPDDKNTLYMTLITGIQTFGGLFQLLSPYLFEKRKKRKPLAFALYGVYYTTYLSLPLLILTPMESDLRIALFIGLVAVSTTCQALGNPALCEWHIANVPDACRSDYMMLRTATDTIVNAILSLTLGLFMDYFKENGQALLGILLMRAVAVIAVGGVFLCFNRAPEPDYNTGMEKAPRIKDIFLAPLTCKPFLLMTLINALATFGTSFVGQFYAVYQLDGAEMSYTFLSICTFASIPIYLLAMPVWNRILHRIGWLPTLAISSAIFSFCYFFNALSTATTHYCYVISVLICQAGAGGRNIACGNLAYLYTPKDMQSSYLAFYNAVSSIASVISVALGGVFMRVTDGKIFSIFGLDLVNGAYISFVSFLLVLLDALLVVGVDIRQRRQNRIKEKENNP